LREELLPAIRNKDDWASVFRKQVRKVGKGWTVRESGHTSKVKLEVRASGQKRQGVTLPFKWNEAVADDAYTRIRNI
tara:strand:+ start:188 stop:418 length:231 start_codon:yes stop_codon:yes gene_type:complete